MVASIAGFPRQAPAAAPASASAPILAHTMGLPMGFEPNRGHAPASALFLLHEGSTTMLLSRNGMASGNNHAPRMRFLSGRTHVRVSVSGALPGKVNYFIGDDPSRWHTNIPTYRVVTFHGVYTGIDLRYGVSSTGMQATWLIAPGADAHRIAMTAGEPLVAAVPSAFQMIRGIHHVVQVRADRRRPGYVHFDVGPYNRAVPLVVSPALTFATNLGGSNSDFAGGITVDAHGNSYIAGSTASPDFPTLKAVQPNEPGTTDQEDAFVAKLNPTGTALLFSTYLGGNNDEDGAAIALGTGGATYVTGFTRSLNFPELHGVQRGGCNAGGSAGGDAFVVKLNAAGNKLLYASCLGGSQTDWGTGIAVDAHGEATVSGSTGSSDFPTINALQPHRGGGLDGFVSKIASSGNHLLFSTYLGGSGNDGITGIALDHAGSMYLAGSTNSAHFPRHASSVRQSNGGTDAFLAKLAPSGRSLAYVTFLSGSGTDSALGVAVGSNGAAYAVGQTDSPNFPAVNALQKSPGGGIDAFVVEVAPSDGHIVYSTYLGGANKDVATAVAVDSAGAIHVTGSTASPDFPTEAAPQSTYAGGYFYGDAFVAELTAGGQSLAFSTYLGGSGDDVGTSVAVNAAGDTYVTGGTSSAGFPSTHEIDGARPARGNAFVVRISTGSALTASLLA